MYAPLYSALLELKNKNQLSFHMPGHLGRLGMEGFTDALDIDVTELPESDNLFSPSGPIAEAESAAAAFFGAERTRFLVGGSSSGVLAMVGAAVKDGEKLICDRFCHRSLVSALVFSGAVPVWVQPETVHGGAMWGGLDPAEIEKAILANPDAKAVFITSPNYFGICSDVVAIAEVAHKHGLPLLVDSAHGAHFGLSPLLPPPAWRLGADLCVAGAHKTLPALTQTAYLHINREFPQLEGMLKMHQTSSPSYVLMASLDFARAKMEADGQRLWTELYENVQSIFPEQEQVPGVHSKYKDPTRLILPLGGSPFIAADRLRREFGISVEMSYGDGVVCIANPSHTAADLRRLRSAADALQGAPSSDKALRLAPSVGISAMTPRAACLSDTEEIPLSEAEGRICAREILLYPPGVPRVLPGELVTADDIAVIEKLIAAGGEVHGAENGRILCVKL